MSAAPPYVPAFFMAAQQLARLDRIAEARTVLRDGIEASPLGRQQPRRRRDERIARQPGRAGRISPLAARSSQGPKRAARVPRFCCWRGPIVSRL